MRLFTGGKPTRCRPAASRRPSVMASATCVDAQRVKVSFRLPYRANFGENLCLVGSASPLGEWDVSRGVSMTWSAGDVWKADLDVDMEPERELQYKYVIKGSDGGVVSWMAGKNIALKLPSASVAFMEIMDAWDGSSHDVVWNAAEEVFEKAINLSREEEVNVVASATRRAFRELEDLLDGAMVMMTRVSDPADLDALATDVKIASKARKALALATAVDVDEVQEEVGS